jgi:hypothetical protein
MYSGNSGNGGQSYSRPYVEFKSSEEELEVEEERFRFKGRGDKVGLERI